jgi:hypothetical protein
MAREKGPTMSAERLAQLLEERIAEMGHTQRSLAEETARCDPRGRGVHANTLRNIIHCSVTPSPRTRSLIEQALRWPRGTITSILAGDDVAPPSAGQVVAEDLASLKEEMQALREQVERLADIVRAAI